MSSPIDEQDGDASHRPGLGPMVKMPLVNDQAANKFRKAAAAAGAFKPRAGGAAAKLFNKETKASDEPDGVSAVFVPQRPTPKEMSKETPQQEEEKKPEEAPIPVPDRVSKERPRISTEVVPSVTVSGPVAPPITGAMQEPGRGSPPASPREGINKKH